MSQERVVDIIEDLRKYQFALRAIAEHVDSPGDCSASKIMELITGSGARYDHPCPPPGPWPTLTDHIARCKDCKPSEKYTTESYNIESLPGIGDSALLLTLCEEGFELWKKYIHHWENSRESADKGALL